MTDPAADFAALLRGEPMPNEEPPSPPGPRLPAPNLLQGAGGNPIPDPHAAQHAFEDRIHQIITRNDVSPGTGGWVPLEHPNVIY